MSNETYCSAAFFSLPLSWSSRLFHSTPSEARQCLFLPFYSMPVLGADTKTLGRCSQVQLLDKMLEMPPFSSYFVANETCKKNVKVFAVVLNFAAQLIQKTHFSLRDNMMFSSLQNIMLRLMVISSFCFDSTMKTILFCYFFKPTVIFFIQITQI